MADKGELTFDDLKPNEQEDFLKFINDEKMLAKYVKEWKPWWRNLTVFINNYLFGIILNI